MGVDSHRDLFLLEAAVITAAFFILYLWYHSYPTGPFWAFLVYVFRFKSELDGLVFETGHFFGCEGGGNIWFVRFDIVDL